MATQKRTTVAGGRRVAKKAPNEQRHMAQVMICGGLFVALVGVKLLLPMTGVAETISGLLTHNMDVASVFSAVGTISQDGDVGEELYQAVFGETTEPQVIVAEDEPITIVETQGAIVEEPVYTQENLPDNVSMEQTVLGFPYQSPLQGTITSGFGYRSDPMEGDTWFHYGVDIDGNTGDAISAFADGTVRAVGESSSYGKYLIVDHADGYATLYAHCNAISVTANSTVFMGQTIAEVGETGQATSPHLHFELLYEDLYLNPVYYV